MRAGLHQSRCSEADFRRREKHEKEFFDLPREKQRIVISFLVQNKKGDSYEGTNRIGNTFFCSGNFPPLDFLMQPGGR